MMGPQGMLWPRFSFHMFSASWGFQSCSLADYSCVSPHSYKIKMSHYWDFMSILKERVFAWTWDGPRSSPGFAVDVLGALGKPLAASSSPWNGNLGIDGLLPAERGEDQATHLPGWKEDSYGSLTEFGWWDRLLGRTSPNFRKHTTTKRRFPFWGEDGGQIAPLEKELGHPTLTHPRARNATVLGSRFSLLLV